MKQVLVTGASGFVGSHVLMALEAHAAEDGIRPVAACRNAGRLPAAYQGEARCGDLREAGYLASLLEGIDMVVHAASWSSLWGNEAASRARFLAPSLSLLEACEARGIQRFLFVSSTSVPGPRALGDPLAPGLKPGFWPHLTNVSRIEEAMRAAAGRGLGCVNLRCGLFAGEHYGLGLLPILLPRLKTHLVPWVSGGRTGMPIIDGRDIGEAFRCAVLAEGLSGYESFNIVGPEVPRVREVVDFLHAEFGYPRPHFSVPFPAGYAFAWLMERLDPLVPWEPLVVRSIIHLLEETHADNAAARERLGYVPRVDWRSAIRAQLAEMAWRQRAPMSMAMPAS
jgi:nucleoside-diphosphate-sugar epimerase